MNNLESLRSQLLVEYSEQDLQQWRSTNFYQHHNLPFRSLIKTREGSSKQNPRGTLLHLTSKKPSSRPPANPEPPIGRNLFQDVTSIKVPGPGYYDWQLRRHSSHCYIKKEQKFLQDKIAKRLRRRQLINECRGPGIYNPEKAFNFTSKSRTASQGKISQGRFNRGIVAEGRGDLYLASTLSERTLRNGNVPGPSRYQVGHASLGTSRYLNPAVHKMSVTQRSNIAKQDGLPGPGFYRWDKLFERKLQGQKAKAKVEFKFVYGHPS